MQKELEKTSLKELVLNIRYVLKTYWDINRVVTALLVFYQSYGMMDSLVRGFFFARMIDEVVTSIQNDSRIISQDLLSWIVLFVVMLMFSMIISRLGNYAESFANLNMYPRLRLMLMAKVNELGVETLEDPEVANMARRVEEGLNHFAQTLNRSVSAVSLVITLVVTTGVLLAKVPVMVLVIGVIGIPMFFANNYFVKKAWRIHKGSTERRRGAYTSSYQTTEPQALQEIQITGAYSYLEAHFRDFLGWFENEVMSLAKRRESIGSLLGFLMALGQATGYLSVFWAAIQRLISIGDITFYTAAINQFASSVSRFGIVVTQLNEAAIRISEARLFFAMERYHPDGAIVLPRFVAPPSIEFKDVSFRYPRANKDVIGNLNLKIKSGEKIAIVGENGAGKTTLVRLIAKLYPVTSGQILINGTNINDLKIDDWYKNIGVLFQDFNRYHQLTVAENIHLGRSVKSLDQDKMKRAVELSDASKFIDEFPFGFDTVLSERFKKGTRLSTGMWQKLAIARFFYRDAPLAIFDEPTAAIDAMAEARIFSRIYKFMDNKTVIIISHRFSTVKNADRIIVFDKGNIIEEGSHSELMKLNGGYAEAFNIQAQGYTDIKS